MNEQEQRIAIAEACGIKDYGEREGYFRFSNSKGFNCHTTYDLPDYLHDLNAMQSAVLARDAEFQAAFDSEMKRRSGYRHQHLASEWAGGFIAVLQIIRKRKVDRPTPEQAGEKA